jgi:hypothetical protein
MIEVGVKLTPSVVTRHSFLVCEHMLGGVDIILGQDWLLPRNANIFFSIRKAQFQHCGKWILLDPDNTTPGASLEWGVHSKGKKRSRSGRVQDDWTVTLFSVLREGEGAQEPFGGDLGEEEGGARAPGEDGTREEMEGDPEGYSMDDITDDSSGMSTRLAQAVANVDPLYRDKLLNLLSSYQDRFPTGLPGLPPERKVYHTIRLEEGHRPPNRAAYRLGPNELKECQDTCDDLLSKGMIQPSCSPFAAPVLFVRKKEGTLRMVVDYRQLNAITISDRYPIPRIDDLIDKLKGAKVFTSMDLLSGYHQVRLKEEDIPKTAFRTPFGLYEFKVLPFGLTNAPATFQRLMNELFHDFIREGFVVVYLDDLLIFSKSHTQHLEHVRRVLERMRTVELFAKLIKCDFMTEELFYLGHIISKDGVKVDPRKTCRVQEWPRPQIVKHIRQFLGLANYFRKYIKGYSTVAAPLTRLTGSTVAWEWGKEQEEAFQALKEALTSAPVLVLPDVQKPFTVVCDASDYGVGAVLLQEERVVAFYSAKLSKAEQNYCATERELLAVVKALTEWRHYVLGKPVTVVTDHRCNTFLSQQGTISPRRARWAERLAEFEVKWEWQPGRTNIADPLSRVPQPLDGGDELGGRLRLGGRLASTVGTVVMGTPRAILGASSLGPLSTGDPGAATSGVNAPSPVRYADFLELLRETYTSDEWLGRRANRRKVHFRDGVWKTKQGQKYVPQYYEVPGGEGMVTRNLRQEVLQSLHGPPYVGHPGVAKMLEMVQREWWWPGITTDVKAFVKYCDSCQRVKASNMLPAGLLHPLQIPERKWQSIGMDLITKLPRSANGNDCIWVVIDRLSKCAHFWPTKSTADSYDIALLLKDKVWRYHGFPEEIVSDRDPRFVSKMMDILLSLTGCKPARSTAYHPQTDGQTERTNRILKDYLKHYCYAKGAGEWEEHLAEAEFAYNNSWQASINTTPFRLTYGCDPNIPFAMGHMGGVQGRSEMKADVFMRKMQESLTLARKFLAAAQDRQRRVADAGRRDVHYATGSWVLWSPERSAGQHVSFGQQWIGPLQVASGTSPTHPNTVLLSLPKEYSVRSNTINVSALRPYQMPPGAAPPQDLPLPFLGRSPETGKRELQWLIERITHHDQQPGNDEAETPQWNADGTRRLRYWVRWLKFSPAFDSPEPLESFWPDAMDVIQAYHKKKKLGRIPWTEEHGVEDSFDAPPEPVQAVPTPRKRKAGRRAQPRASKLAALVPTPLL